MYTGLQKLVRVHKITLGEHRAQYRALVMHELSLSCK